MKNVISMTSSIIALIFLLTAFTACSPLTKNTGKKAVKKFSVDMSAGRTDDSTWETKELFIVYDIIKDSDSFLLSGELTIKDEILLSFSVAKFFHLYLNFLNEDGRIIGIHDVSPNIGYQQEIPPKIKLRNVPPSPPGAEAFTFSYWGYFTAGMTDGQKSASWEVYFNPIEKEEE